MRVVLDRIEGAMAVLLLGEQSFDVPASLLPAGAAEGQAFELDLRAALEDEDRSAALSGRLKALAEEDDGGDFTL